MLELIVSIGIIGTSLILVVGIFTVLVSGSQKASDLTSGSVVADGIMSQTIYQVLANQTAFFRDASYSTPQVFRGGTYQLNNTVYFYKLYCTDASLTGQQLTFYSNDDGQVLASCMRRFDLVVWWNDASAAAQTSTSSLSLNRAAQGQGMGLQEVHQMRLVWPDGSL